MRYQHAVDLYRHVAVETADPLGLVVMAYEGALSAMDRAIAALDEKDYKRKGEEIQKAIALISELMAALDMERGEEIARSLYGLYGYFLKRLMIADVRKDKAALQEVRGHFVQLHSAWEEVARGGAKGTSAEAEKRRAVAGEAHP